MTDLPLPSSFSPPPVNRNWQEMVRDSRRRIASGTSVRFDLPHGDWVAPADETASSVRMAELLRFAKPFYRIKQPHLRGLLQAGRAKTLFETGASNGFSVAGWRRAVEYQHFGIPTDAPAAARPVYGYLHSEPDGVFADLFPADPLNQYGRVSLRLRPEVLERTTFTGGDSLAQLFMSDEILVPRVAAARFHEPDWCAFDPGLGDPLRYATLRDLIRTATLSSAGYIEAHYHGGLSVTDIERVFFYEPPKPETLELLSAQDIPSLVV